MKLLKRVRRVLESALVLFARGSISLLSRLAVVRLSGFLGICAYSFSPSSRRVSLANLKIAFGDSLSEPEMRVISKASFQHFCLSLLDLFWFNRNTPERMKLYFRYDPSFEAVFDGTPHILISGHLGNWEVMGLGCGQRGLPVTAVVMPSKNAFAESELARLLGDFCVVIADESLCGSTTNFRQSVGAKRPESWSFDTTALLKMFAIRRIFLTKSALVASVNLAGSGFRVHLHSQ